MDIVREIKLSIDSDDSELSTYRLLYTSIIKLCKLTVHVLQLTEHTGA